MSKEKDSLPFECTDCNGYEYFINDEEIECTWCYSTYNRKEVGV